jgi:hypothetical protein
VGNLLHCEFCVTVDHAFGVQDLPAELNSSREELDSESDTAYRLAPRVAVRLLVACGPWLVDFLFDIDQSIILFPRTALFVELSSTNISRCLPRILQKIYC